MLTTLPKGRALRDRNMRAESQRMRSVLSAAALLMIAGLFLMILLEVIFPGFMPHSDGRTPSVNMAQVAHAAPQRGALREDAIFVSVAHDGKVYVGAKQIDPQDVVVKIKEAIASGSPRKIYIKADARARYGRVEEVVRELQAAGFKDIVFITEEWKPVP